MELRSNNGDLIVCDISNNFSFQVPRDPDQPCELCYCIRNHTACVRQECDLKVPGCDPIYQDGVCCPVKYRCGKFKFASTPHAFLTQI